MASHILVRVLLGNETAGAVYTQPRPAGFDQQLANDAAVAAIAGVQPTRESKPKMRKKKLKAATAAAGEPSLSEGRSKRNTRKLPAGEDGDYPPAAQDRLRSASGAPPKVSARLASARQAASGDSAQPATSQPMVGSSVWIPLNTHPLGTLSCSWAEQPLSGRESSERKQCIACTANEACRSSHFDFFDFSLRVKCLQSAGGGAAPEPALPPELLGPELPPKPSDIERVIDKVMGPPMVDLNDVAGVLVAASQ